jgi:hypothetical protein
LAIVLFVLRYTDSNYPFGIFKLFPQTQHFSSSLMEPSSSASSKLIVEFSFGGFYVDGSELTDGCTFCGLLSFNFAYCFCFVFDFLSSSEHF